MIPEADMPPRKRARFVAPSRRFKIRESSVVAATRHPGPTLARGTQRGFMTSLEEGKESVTDIAVMHRQDSKEFHMRHQDAQHDRAILRARVSTFKSVTEPGRMLEISYVKMDQRMLGAAVRLKMPPKKAAMSEAVINRLLAQRVADVLAEYETNRSSGNGNDNGNKIYDSGSGDEGRRTLLESARTKTFWIVNPLTLRALKE
ncbi:hypothetical protein Tco_1499784 [Tanacetum coccineum]